MKETPIYHQGNLIGYIARTYSVFGIFSNELPYGYMFRRKDEQYNKEVYSTRGMAKRALLTN